MMWSLYTSVTSRPHCLIISWQAGKNGKPKKHRQVVGGGMSPSATSESDLAANEMLGSLS